MHSTSLQVASHRIELAFENSQLKHGGRAMPLLSIFDLDFFLSRSYQAHLCLSPFMPCWKPTRGWQWYWLHRRQGHSHHFTSIILYSNACSSADTQILRQALLVLLGCKLDRLTLLWDNTLAINQGQHSMAFNDRI